MGVLAACITLVWTLASAVATVVVPPEPEPGDRAVAVAVLPTLAGGPVAATARTTVGTRVLPPQAEAGPWRLYRVDPPARDLRSDTPSLVVVWLVPTHPRADHLRYLCPDCVAWGVPALVRAATDGAFEVLAVGAALRIDGRFDVQVGRPIRVGKRRLYVARRRYRTQGIQVDDLLLWRRRDRRLVLLGAIPTLATNEGACGRIGRVVAAGRPIGRRSACTHVWRFEADLRPSRGRIVASERLREARARRYRLRERKRTVRYRIGRALQPSRSSLRALVPLTLP